MFKKIVFTLLLTILGSQTYLASNTTWTSNKLQQAILQDLSSQNLEILEEMVKESQELQALVEKKTAKEFDLYYFFTGCKRYFTNSLYSECKYKTFPPYAFWVLVIILGVIGVKNLYHILENNRQFEKKRTQRRKS